MNRYTITHKDNGKIFKVKSETFPPNGKFSSAWGDPGQKVLQEEATQEQKDNSLGTYSEYNVLVVENGNKEKKDFHYYVLTDELDYTIENIDAELAAAEQKKQDKKSAGDRLRTLDVDADIQNVADIKEVLDDLIKYLF